MKVNAAYVKATGQDHTEDYCELTLYLLSSSIIMKEQSQMIIYGKINAAYVKVTGQDTEYYNNCELISYYSNSAALLDNVPSAIDS